jgi:hypothetical protein
LRAPACGEPDRDIAGPPEGLDLPSEDKIETIVIPDRRQGGRVDRESLGGHRAALHIETPDELSGDVLGVGRASAIAEQE